MALDLAAITQNAVNAAAKVGVTASCTITRPAPPPDPLTGVQSGSAVTQTVRAIPTDAARIARSLGGAWSQVSAAIFVAMNDVTFTPAVGDAGSFAGATMRITVTHTYAPGGTPIAYLLGMGA